MGIDMSEKIRSAPSPGETRQGKSKDILYVSRAEMEHFFTDRLTVFDVKKPNYIPQKGATLAQTAEYMFGVAGDLGINTHFLKMTGPNSMMVRRLEVVENAEEIDRPNTFIPLEFIIRNYVEGSLLRAVQKNEITAAELGFENGHAIRRGDRLMKQRFEMWTKLERVDRLLTHEEALRVGGISEDTVDRIRDLLFRLNDKIQEVVRRNSARKIDGELSCLIRVDGKAELGLDGKRRPIMVDSFANADEDRYWEGREYGNGRFLDKSKEFVRQHYIETGYYGELTAVREINKKLKASGMKLEPEPDLPLLSPQMIKMTSELYIEMFERLTGKTFVPQPYRELIPVQRN